MHSEWLFYARRLRNVQRCGTLRVISKETVAEHSYYTAMIAMDICDKIEARNSEKLDSYQLLHDRYEVLLGCIFHDIEEGIAGDIPYPFKAVSKEFRDTVESATNGVCKLFFPERVQRYRRWAKDGLLGEIVTCADYIELAYYCAEEMLLGNQDVQFKEIYQTCAEICRKTSIWKIASAYFYDIDEYLRNDGVSGQNERMVRDGSSN